VSRLDPVQRAWLVAVVLLSATLAGYHLPRITPIAPPHDLQLFPTRIGAWRGELRQVALEPMRPAGADDEMARVYWDQSGQAVSVYLAYFRSQEQDRELVSWVTRGFHRTAVEVPMAKGSGEPHRINRVTVKDGRETRVIHFWYDINGRVVSSRYLAKLATIADAALRGRSNGALVVVSQAAADDRDADRAAAAAMAFLEEFFPAVRAYLAGEAA